MPQDCIMLFKLFSVSIIHGRGIGICMIFFEKQKMISSNVNDPCNHLYKRPLAAEVLNHAKKH